MTTQFITLAVSAYRCDVEPAVTLFIEGPKGGTQHICRVTREQAETLRDGLNMVLAPSSDL